MCTAPFHEEPEFEVNISFKMKQFTVKTVTEPVAVEEDE